MIRILAVCLLVLLVPAAGAQTGPNGVGVDVELVLAVDVSGSMDDEEHALQRAGYVDAIRHPDFWRAVSSGGWQRVALTYVEWAGPTGQVTVVDWTLIDSAQSARAFSDTLSAIPIAYIRGTSISGALIYSSGLFDGNGFSGQRRVIDISGDGPNNRGERVDDIRDAVVARGIIINGLPIMLRPSASLVGLDIYYADCVIGGPGAFVLPVRKPEELGEAIRRKLVLDLASGNGSDTIIPVQDRERTTDCLIGEKIRRDWDDS
jgi:hypothetical protein